MDWLGNPVQLLALHVVGAIAILAYAAHLGGAF